MQDPGSNTINQFLIADKAGDPMFWVNLEGAQSGGEPVCVLGLDLKPRACLGGPLHSYGGQGSITLYDADGENPVTLTYSELQKLVTLAGGSS